MHPGIFRVESGTTREQRQCLLVPPQLHQQTAKIVIRRKSFWIEFEGASQQTLSFGIFSSLTRDVAKVRKYVRIVRLQLEGLLKSRDCLVILSFSAPSVAEQKIEVGTIGVSLDRLRKDFARSLVTLTANVSDTQPEEVNQLSLGLLQCFFVKRNRIVGELFLEQLLADHEVGLRK